MGRVEDEVRTLIKQRFGSIPKFADVIHLPSPTIYSALRNGLAGASMATVMPIVVALRLDLEQLQQGNVVCYPASHKGYVDTALFGRIPAGQPRETIPDLSVFPMPAQLRDKHPHAFLLRVSGESMNRVFPDATLVLIDPTQTDIVSGKIYAVGIGTDDATVKRVTRLSNGLQLDPDSTDPTFKPHIFDASDPTTGPVRILGRVVWYCPPFDWADIS